jgi:hypothetical protein
MKNITLIMVGILVMTVGLSANIPYTFQPNSSAKASEVNANFKALSNSITKKASEVNANFKALSDSITKLENDSSSGRETSCDKSVSDKSVFPYTYQYISSNIGDTITVGGIEYIIVALPFIEHATGDKYYLKRPIIKSRNNNYNIDLRISLITGYVQQDDTCYSSTFSGFPANFHDGIYYRHHYGATIYDTTNSSSTFTISAEAGHWIAIKINQTVFTLWSNLESKKLQDTPLSTGDVDLRDNIDWLKMGVDLSLIDDVKTLMNYIKIIKIP